MEILVLAVLLGLLPAFIAKSKGRSFMGWWIYGALLWIVAFPHSLIMRSDQRGIDAQARRDGMKKCPACAEMIRREARVCRFCQHDQALA